MAAAVNPEGHAGPHPVHGQADGRPGRRDHRAAGQVGTGADTRTVVSAVEAAIQRAVTDANINTREI
ncbi:hypothetical protein ACIQCQ_37790 [Streptomyces sp. NPDC088394]|uniref:hypothetical protein n=1 Tax=Streptomyces sp. NPDC088394 TaxID=3365860 RepID=UPI003821A0D3